MTGQALSGSITITGSPEQPFRAAVSYVDYCAAASAAFGTIAALFARQATGAGRHVEVSLLGTALTIMNPMLIEEASGARSRVALGNRSPISGPSDLFKARDGWIFVQVIGQDMFERWLATVGAEDLHGDARFDSDLARGENDENGEELSRRMQAWCGERSSERSSEECLAELKSGRVPACRVVTPGEAVRAAENAPFFNWTGTAAADGNVPLVRTIAQFSAGLADSERYRPAPALGQDSRAVLAECGYAASEIERLLKGAEPVPA